jgi:hypothetical protein
MDVQPAKPAFTSVEPCAGRKSVVEKPVSACLVFGPPLGKSAHTKSFKKRMTVDRKAPCDKKADLLSTYRRTARTYSISVSELSDKLGKVEAIEFDRLAFTSERARKLCYAAHQLLASHLDEHGC